MACDLTTIQEEACTSEIGKVTSEIMLLRLIAQLTCEAAASSSAATAAVSSGVGAPVADPGVTTAIYIDTSTGVVYYWYTSAWH